jgi:hypothetical protein
MEDVQSVNLLPAYEELTIASLLSNFKSNYWRLYHNI